MKTTLPQDAETRKLDHYDEQIAALTRAVEAEERGDARALNDAMNDFAHIIGWSRDREKMIGAPALLRAWVNTGMAHKSLFASLPGTCCCPTQTKLHSEQFGSQKFIALVNAEDLIPEHGSNIRLHMLPSFARVQRKARGL